MTAQEIYEKPLKSYSTRGLLGSLRTEKNYKYLGIKVNVGKAFAMFKNAWTILTL
jgi:uncharacterized protein (UPF0548 family)